MDEIVTTIEIDAPPQAVWDVLLDFDQYDQWNPTIDITGTPEEGERISLVLTLPERKPQAFRPKLLTVDEPTELRWQGRLFVPGLYDGEHRFVLEGLDGGERTRLTHAETFRGVLVGFINRRVGADIKAGFARTNEALKSRVEGNDVTDSRGGVDVEADS
ncbi:MAG: SRPBCC domain-containing protein [Halovenus sp.]